MAAVAVAAAVAGQVVGLAGLVPWAGLAALMEVAEADLAEAEGGAETAVAGRMEAIWAVAEGMGAEEESQVVMAVAMVVEAEVVRRALGNCWSFAPIAGGLACNMRCRSRKTSDPR